MNNKLINRFKEIFSDKNSALAAMISALFCPVCFPAFAGVAAALGLPFLTRYEGIFLAFFHLSALASLFIVWSGFRRHGVKLPLAFSALGIFLIFGALYALIPVYDLAYLGIFLLVVGAFLNAYHTRKFSELNCDCETAPQS